jgi:hypothetical protein
MTHDHLSYSTGYTKVIFDNCLKKLATTVRMACLQPKIGIVVSDMLKLKSERLYRDIR